MTYQKRKFDILENRESRHKIKKLEKLVAFALEGLNNLRAEKFRLEQRVRELEKEKTIALKENERAKGSQEELKQLKV